MQGMISSATQQIMNTDIPWKYFQWLTELMYESQSNQDVPNSLWDIGWNDKMCSDLEYERWYLRSKMDAARHWGFDFDFDEAQTRVDQLFHAIRAVSRGSQYCRMRWEYKIMAIEECLLQLDRSEYSGFLLLICKSWDTHGPLKSEKFSLSETLLKIRGQQK